MSEFKKIGPLETLPLIIASIILGFVIGYLWR